MQCFSVSKNVQDTRQSKQAASSQLTVKNSKLQNAVDDETVKAFIEADIYNRDSKFEQDLVWKDAMV